MSKHAVKKIVYLTEKEYASDILDGKHVYNPKLDEFTNKFLTFIAKHPSLSPFKGDIHRTDFIHCWGRSREKSPASLSEHFGHYKTASRSHKLSEFQDSFLHVASLSAIF